MKNKLKEEMLKEIFVQTGGRPENPKIADVCAEIAVKFFSSNAVLAVTSDSKENKKESEVAVCRHTTIKLKRKMSGKCRYYCVDCGKMVAEN